MQCNTNYTGDLENFKFINLNVLKKFMKTFPNLILGLSDHTPGHSTVLGAIALGAKVIEKHFTDDNNRSGPDHLFSMNPISWREMIDRTRELELALGSETKKVEKNEIETHILQRRSLRCLKNLKKGELVNINDFFPLRPCPEDALDTSHLSKINGLKLLRDLNKDEYLKVSDINFIKD